MSKAFTTSVLIILSILFICSAKLTAKIQQDQFLRNTNAEKHLNSSKRESTLFENRRGISYLENYPSSINLSVNEKEEQEEKDSRINNYFYYFIEALDKEEYNFFIKYSTEVKLIAVTKQLGEALKKTTKLKVFTFGYYHKIEINTKIAINNIVIDSLISNKSIINLRLSGIRYIDYYERSVIRLNDTTAKSISTLISTSKTIEKLNLSNNSLNDEEIIILKDSIIGNKLITEINLSRNDLGKNSASSLSQIIRENKTILKLDLSCNNEIKLDKDFFKSFEKNESITEINLRGTFKSDTDKNSLNYFIDLIKNNNTITKIDIANNSLNIDDVELILDALENNIHSKLKVLDITGNARVGSSSQYKANRLRIQLLNESKNMNIITENFYVC